MSTVEAIYSSGVFKPLAEVSLAQNQRVRLTIETDEGPSSAPWLTEAREFQRQMTTRYGVLPDSTPEIAADRRRHE